MNEPNDPAEQQPPEPMTPEACLAEAITNLRQAEAAWQDSRVPADAVRNVIDIACGWVQVAAETRVQIPSRLVLPQHRGPCPVGPHCRDCHMETHRIDPVTDTCTVCKSDAAQIWEHGIGCVGGLPRTIAPGTKMVAEMHTEPYIGKPITVRWAGASAVDEQSRAAFKSHTFRSISGACLDCDATPAEALAGQVCTRTTKTHEHGPNCRHAWVHATAPCANGCDAMPEGYYIGSKSPTEVCPKSSCPDVNA